MYKRLKKVVAVVFIMASLLTLFGPAALATVVPDGILNKIDLTNDYIYREIDKAQEKAEKEVLKNQSEQELNEAIDKIINQLIEKTDGKVVKLIEKAATDGIVIEKNYIEIQIHDRVVLVDPFYAH